MIDGCSIRFTLMVASAACSGGDKTTVAQIEADISIGTVVEHLSDASPTKSSLGDEFHLTTQVMTSGGNRLSVILAKNTVVGPDGYDVGVGSAVQAGFTVPGSSGVVFFETGTFNITAVDWSSGGRVVATFAGLHRPADSLGLAPEASADGVINVVVP